MNRGGATVQIAREMEGLIYIYKVSLNAGRLDMWQTEADNRINNNLC